jgi:hypothetical protein
MKKEHVVTGGKYEEFYLKGYASCSQDNRRFGGIFTAGFLLGLFFNAEEGNFSPKRR